MFPRLHVIILWFLATTSNFTKGSHHLYMLRSPCVSVGCMYNQFIKYPWNLQQDSSPYLQFNLNLMQSNIRNHLPQIINQHSVETDGLPDAFLQSLNTKQYPQHYNKMVTRESQIVPLMQQFSSTEAPYRFVQKPHYNKEVDYLLYTKQQNSGYHHVSNNINQVIICCSAVFQPSYNQIIISMHHSPPFSNKEDDLGKATHKILENKIASKETEDQKQKYEAKKYNDQTIFTRSITENVKKAKPVNEKITNLAQLYKQYIESTVSSVDKNDKYDEKTKNYLTGSLSFSDENTESSVDLGHTKKDYNNNNTTDEKMFDYLIFPDINNKEQNKDPEQTTLEDIFNEFDVNYMKKSELNNAALKIEESDEQFVADDDKTKEYYDEQLQTRTSIILNTEDADKLLKINTSSEKINFEPSNNLTENITKADDVDVNNDGEKSKEYSVEQFVLSIKLNSNTEQTPNEISISSEKINFKSLNHSSENNKYNFSSIEDPLKSYDGRDLNLLEHLSEVSDLLLSNNLETTTIFSENADMTSEIEHSDLQNTLMQGVHEGKNINDLKTNIKLEIQEMTDSYFNMKDLLTTTVSYEDINITSNHETNEKISYRVNIHNSDFNTIRLNDTVFSSEEIISPTTENSFYHLLDYITEIKNMTENKNNTEDMEASSVKLMTTESLSLFYKDTFIIDNKEFTKEDMTPDVFNHEYNLKHSKLNFNSGEMISYNNSDMVVDLMNSRNNLKTSFDDMIVINDKTMTNYSKQNNSSIVYTSEQWSDMNTMATENISSTEDSNSDSSHETDIEINSFSSVYGTSIPLEITSNLFITDPTEQTDSSYDIYSSPIQDAELVFDVIDTVENSTSKNYSAIFTTPIYINNEPIFEQKPLLNLISSNIYPVYEAQDLSAENKTFSQIISNVSNIKDKANIQSQNNILFLQNGNSTINVYNAITTSEKIQNIAENNILNNSLTIEDVHTGVITINQFDINNNSSHDIFFENNTETVNLTNLTNYADELMMSSPNFYSFNNTNFNNEILLINVGKRNFSEDHNMQVTHTFQDSLRETIFNVTDYQYKLNEFSSDNSTDYITETSSLESDSEDFEKAQQQIKDEILIKTSSEESDESNMQEKISFTVHNMDTLLGLSAQLVMIKDVYNESLQESGEKNLKSGVGISFTGDADKIIQKREFNIHNNHNDAEFSYENKFGNNNDTMFRVLTLNKLASNGSSHKERIMNNNSLHVLINTEPVVKTKRKNRSITLRNDYDKIPLIFQRNGCMNCNSKSTNRHKIINLQSLKMFNNNNNSNNNNNDSLIDILSSILFKNQSTFNGSNHMETMENNSESVNKFLESKDLSSRSSRSIAKFRNNTNEIKSLFPIKQKITCLNCSSNVNFTQRNMNKQSLEGFDEINKLYNTEKSEERKNCKNVSVILCYLLKEIYSINSDNFNKEKNFKNVSSSVDDVISFHKFNRTDYKFKNKLEENDKILDKHIRNNNYKQVYNSSKNQNDNIMEKRLIRRQRSSNSANQGTVFEKKLSNTIQLKQSERAAILALLKENSEGNFKNDKSLKEDRYIYEDYYYDDYDDDEIKLTRRQNDEYIEDKYDDYYDGDSILELISSNITREYIIDQPDDLS